MLKNFTFPQAQDPRLFHNICYSAQYRKTHKMNYIIPRTPALDHQTQDRETEYCGLCSDTLQSRADCLPQCFSDLELNLNQS